MGGGLLSLEHLQHAGHIRCQSLRGPCGKSGAKFSQFRPPLRRLFQIQAYGVTAQVMDMTLHHFMALCLSARAVRTEESKLLRDLGSADQLVTLIENKQIMVIPLGITDAQAFAVVRHQLVVKVALAIPVDVTTALNQACFLIGERDAQRQRSNLRCAAPALRDGRIQRLIGAFALEATTVRLSTSVVVSQCTVKRQVESRPISWIGTWLTPDVGGF